VIVIANDCETHRFPQIEGGMYAMPMKLVCVTMASDAFGVDAEGKVNSKIFTAKDGLEATRACLRDPNVISTGHHFFFDLITYCAEDAEDPRIKEASIYEPIPEGTFLEDVFNALDDGRIHCTKIRQQLIDNAQGELKYLFNEDTGEWESPRYHLSDLVRRWFNRTLSKGGKDDEEGIGRWRLRFGELDGLPISEWAHLAPGAEEYARKDAVEEWQVHQAQQAWMINQGVTEIPGEMQQVRAGWALNLFSTWGVRTQQAAIDAYRQELEVQYEDACVRAKKAGLMRPQGTKDTKAIQKRVQEWYTSRDKQVVLTPKGAICCEKKILVATDDPGLHAIADCNKYGKTLKTYIPLLEKGTRYPICARYNIILETIRTSCSAPNLQNQPRKGKVRLCFIPRIGWVYMNCDYDTLEMRTLAQVCIILFGYSAIAEAIKRDLDIHIALAADMLGLTYEDALARFNDDDKQIIDARQIAKPGNYGFGGGMGAAAFVDYCKAQGIELHPDRIEAVKISKQLHAAFRTTWPEMVQYFEHCSNLCGPDGYAEVQTFIPSKMVRGKVKYTAVCNGYFQHLAACGAKDALYESVRGMYLGKRKDGSFSDLYGCRGWLFAHDEIGAENPWYGAAAFDPIRGHLAAMELRRLMIECMQAWCPDVPIGASVTMARLWHKGAKPVYMEPTPEMIDTFYKAPATRNTITEIPKKIIIPCKPDQAPVLDKVTGKQKIDKKGKPEWKTIWIPDLYDNVEQRIAA
jgi:hypothetical protein